MTSLGVISYVTPEISQSLLLVTHETLPWQDQVVDSPFSVDIIQDQFDAVKLLRKQSYDMVILNDATIDNRITELVTMLKENFPLMVVCVLTLSENDEYLTDLMIAGTDDIFMPDVAAEILLRRLHALQRQQQEKISLAQRNQETHAISMLTQAFHDAEHPMSLIVDTIESICTNFGVYAVALTIDEGERLHLYAGTQHIDNRRRLYESMANMHEYDPLRQVLTYGMSQIYVDIKRHPYYTAIPVIEEPQSAMILPLKYNEQVFGSLALFGKERVFQQSNLAPFELLASHFAVAYYNVRHHHTREIDVRSKGHILRVWQSLTSLYDLGDMTRTLTNLLDEVSSIHHAAVWLFDTSNETNDMLVYSTQDDLTETVGGMHKDGSLTELMREFDSGLKPITLHQRYSRTGPLRAIFNLMESAQILMVPIAGNILVGGIFVSPVGNSTFSSPDISLVESIAHATAQAVERNTLINSLQEQTGRLEAVMRSMREALFFVSDQDLVIFCNPQFTELTSIAPSQIINQSHSNLFSQLASRSDNPNETLKQLQEGMQLALTGSGEDTYSIVEIAQPDGNDLMLEFMMIDQVGAEHQGWIGFLRESNQGELQEIGAEQQHIIGDILEDVGMPLLEIQQTVTLLEEQYRNLSPRRYSQLLYRMNHQTRTMRSLWDNLLQLYRMEVSGVVFEIERLDPAEIIEDLLDNYENDRYTPGIQFAKQPPAVKVDIDEHYLRQAVLNALDFVASYVSAGDAMNITLAPEQDKITLSVQNRNTILSTMELEAVFEPTSSEEAVQDEHPNRVGLYLARQIVDRHGGSLTVESRRGWGLLVKLSLPIAEAAEAIPDAATSVDKSSAASALSIVVVESPAHMLESVYDYLDYQQYEVFVETNVEDAISNLGLTKIDLVVIEAQAGHLDVVDACQRFRRKSEVPIMIVAQPEVEKECIQALQNGADTYQLLPISQEKLVAQLQSLTKRKEIATRTHAPIQIGDLYVDFSRRRVYLGNKLLDLTTKEYELLRVLATHKDQVLSHQQLLTKIWGPEYREETQYLWVNISRLRRKLEPKKGAPRYIHTEQGIGYVFREP